MDVWYGTQEQLNGMWGVAKNEASLTEEEMNSILAESESRIEQLQLENESLMQLVSENQELITEVCSVPVLRSTDIFSSGIVATVSAFCVIYAALNIVCAFLSHHAGS